MRFEVVSDHEDLCRQWGSDLLRASEKGYPEIYDNALHWVMYDEDLPIAYTTSLFCQNFVLVGNTYIRKEYRGRGLHTQLLEYRNKHLGRLPKITCVNPIENTTLEQLTKVISRLGYKKVQKILDVCDIMTDSIYRKIKSGGQEIWRLDYEKQQSSIIQ